MKKVKSIVTKNSKDLAIALGLSPNVGLEFEIRSSLNDKIIETIQKQGLTHSDVAKLANTSRTRITAIMNRNLQEISTDMLLRVLGAIGIRAKIQFTKNAA
jgi:predicted XRE-type DNA-binding protein